ncbi:hypothetical protein A2U01_0058112, partial [Trifolium medium]|nr:hypothetical protein [Trifolium medium]
AIDVGVVDTKHGGTKLAFYNLIPRKCKRLVGGHQGAVLGRERTKNSTDKGGTGGVSADEDDHGSILWKAKDFVG